MARLVPPDDGVVVRMYRIGHGDCFLLAFPRDGEPQPPCPEGEGGGAAGPDDAPVYVLIDCGNKPGSETAEFLHGHAIETVVAHMREACGDRLDLAIATHEHQDHLNGIWRTEDPPFGNLSIARTWFAWTEDPDDALANKLRRDHDDTLLELIGARNKLATAFSADHPDVQQLDLLLGLDGDREEGQRPPVFAARTPIEKDIEKQGLKLLKDRARAQDGVCYLRPGEDPLMIPGTNVKVYVLGPPRSEKLLASANPRKKEGFPDDGPHPFSLGEAALAEQGGESPFARRYGVPLDKARAGDHPFFVQHYGDGTQGETEEDGVETPDNAPFRRIDADWLSAATDLAIALSEGINNTSLVLAFEFPRTRKVLLFVGDAQRGNWVSWVDCSWTVDGTEVTARSLLERTVLYKVGHHGSHNATLNGTPDDPWPNLSWMAFGAAAGEFTALLPAVERWAVKKGWIHPLPAIATALEQKSAGRVLRTDTGTLSKPNDVSAAAWRKFTDLATVDELYFDYVVLDG